MNKIILASTSPRRKDLLEREGINFIVDAFSIEETLDTSLSLEKRLENLAYRKGLPIHKKYPDDIVISADTTVYHDDMIIGKVSNREEAKSVLLSLSNDKHTVYTSVSIFNKDDVYTFVDKTDVYFKDITDMVDDYLDTGDWIGKAGAYGIQSKADIFVDHIEGDIDTVIGLPVKRIKDYLGL